MKLKSTLLIIAAAIGLQANAQPWVADSVEMGAGYGNDIFYNLVSGADVQQPANNWDIAFQMTKFGDPMFNASVRANHNKRDVQVYSLHKQASANFGALTPADTMVVYGTQLLNEDTSWGRGAFTNNKSSAIFDYGWGVYNGTTHFLDGDSLYLVKANGVFYQLWIQKYVSIGNVGYWFRVAKWDGTGDKTDSIKRVAPYTDRLFAYYDFASGTFSDREPSRKDWHIMFTQYLKDRVFGSNPSKYQNYVGVLSNIKVKVAPITGVIPNTVNSGNYQAYTPSASVFTNSIGDNWKRFDQGAFKWNIAPDTSYIILPDTANGKQEYYHLQFTRFDGSASGKIVFDTRLLATYSVGIDKITGKDAGVFSIYPNPAGSDINIMVDAKQSHSNTALTVTDITGKVMMQTTINLNKGFNAYSVNVAAYPAGTYIVTVANDSWKLSDRIVVQH